MAIDEAAAEALELSNIVLEFDRIRNELACYETDVEPLRNRDQVAALLVIARAIQKQTLEYRDLAAIINPPHETNARR